MRVFILMVLFVAAGLFSRKKQKQKQKDLKTGGKILTPFFFFFSVFCSTKEGQAFLDAKKAEEGVVTLPSG